MREKPTRLAAKLKAIRERLGVSQAGMKRLFNFEGDYSDLEFELGRRAPKRLGIRSGRSEWD